MHTQKVYEKKKTGPHGLEFLGEIIIVVWVPLTFDKTITARIAAVKLRKFDFAQRMILQNEIYFGFRQTLKYVVLITLQ